MLSYEKFYCSELSYRRQNVIAEEDIHGAIFYSKDCYVLVMSYGTFGIVVGCRLGIIHPFLSMKEASRAEDYFSEIARGQLPPYLTNRFNVGTSGLTEH